MTKMKSEKSLTIDTLEELPSFYLRIVTYLLSRQLDSRLDGFEVAKGTGKIATLLLIDANPGISPSKISEITFRDRPSISRIIAPLVAAGLVEQRISPTERRAQNLYITQRGHRRANEVRAIVRKNSEDFFADLEAADRNELIRILRKIVERKRDLAP